MNEQKSEVAIVPIKDGTSQRSIPTVWRPALRRVVDAIVLGDYALLNNVDEVEVISKATVLQIQSYIRNYGATLKFLPEDSWNTSVYIWAGNYWDVLVDLYTNEEGLSDLVMSARVTEGDNGYRFSIQMVYVP